MNLAFYLKLTVFCFSCFCVKDSYSQNNASLLKTIQKENPAYKEEFFVLKSDTSIKSGSYIKYAFPKQLITSGFYKSGKKDSAWIDYNRETNSPINKGVYFNGQKKGVWEYYYPSGELALKFDHSLVRTIFCKNCGDTSTKKVLVLKDTSFYYQIVQREAFFNGDSKQLKVFLLKSIENELKKLPKTQKNTVTFKLIIDADGRASKQTIISGLNQETDYKLLMQFKLIPDEWVSSLFQGKPVVSKINFDLEIP